ncbi:DNA-binding PadR family transcriptional regulator [Aquamicrobium lusatiense]|uniref:DNA-binding PadR family transcriptional regulator n=1 Tax=Aquamicrobium lusatiense TaxID=89772 RepID=A0A7W9S5L4_9HYPH|nr:PadR family transcriptional regulator [Aquamicrobium lusatiense]MBB6014546.1 DNA-binding PadR family transcriptional regulator [Aquamicrobium lusatiense]
MKNPARHEALNNLGYQILGVVTRVPRSGYDIVKQLEHFRPAKTSQVYPTLSKLEAAGLVVAEDVEQEGRPNKKVYSATPEGRQALTDWIGTEPEIPYSRDDFLTMIYSAWLKDPADTRRMVEARIERIDRQVAQVQSDLARLIADHPVEIRDPSRWRFYRHSLQGRRLMLAQAERVWCLSLLYQLSGDPIDD